MRLLRTVLATCLAVGGCSAPGVLPPEPEPPPRARISRAEVLDWLRSLPGRDDRRLLSGQNVGHGPDAARGYAAFVEELRRRTGRVPAVIAADYALGTLDPGAIRDINRMLVAHWNRGGLVSVNIASLGNPVTGGDCRDRGGVDLAALTVPGGAGNAAWMAKLEAIAAGLAQLRDAGVVVLWRPLHEMNLPEFWWGTAPPADYVALWRHMHRFFTEDMGLDNLLWVYSPAANPWRSPHVAPVTEDWPGGDVVDIVGLDYYDNGFERLGRGGMDDLLKLGKPFGLTEYGQELDLSQFSARDLREVVAGLRQKAPQAVFCWHWQSWGLSRMALVHQDHVEEALADPWIINRDGVDIPAAAK